MFSEEIDRQKEKLSQRSYDYDQLESRFEIIKKERDELNLIAHDLESRYKEALASYKEQSIHSSLNKEYEAKVRGLTLEMETLSSEVYRLRRENENYKRNAESELIAQSEYEKKLTTLSQEIGRLNTVLKIKVE